MVGRAEQNQIRQQGSAYQQRRKVRAFAKVKNIAKNNKAAASHKSNKLSPKEECRSNKCTKKAAPKRTRKCPAKCKNCGLALILDHALSQHKYDRDRAAKKSKKQKEADEARKSMRESITQALKSTKKMT